MCFNISLQLKKARMEQRYSAIYPDSIDTKPIYHASAFERPQLPLLTNQQPDRFQLMTWGLIPAWVKTEDEAKKISVHTMNARAETIAQKLSFRQSAKTSRCIIPATGFFEWQQVGSKKIPWFITFADDDFFSFAGLWSEWANPLTGEVSHTFSIITTEANELMAKIHNTKKRMPAILGIENEKKWLDSNLEIDTFDTLLKPVDSKLLKVYTVSPLVSQTKQNRNVPEVLSPYNYNSINQAKLF